MTVDLKLLHRIAFAQLPYRVVIASELAQIAEYERLGYIEVVWAPISKGRYDYGTPIGDTLVKSVTASGRRALAAK